jgi:mannose-1-phosphate guanylyltransferase
MSLAPRKTKVLLLAGGLGTRLRPITDQVPKCLVPIAGRPLLDYWFDGFDRAGLTDVLINTHHLAERVREYIAGKNREGRFRVQEAYEPELLGSAGTVHANRSWIGDGENCLIVYADNLSDVDLGRLLEAHSSHGGPVTMMLFRTQYPERCGIATLDEAGRIVEFIEKPKQPKSNLANGGIYCLSPAAYHEMADMNKFDLGFDVLPAFAGRMYGWVCDGYHRDIGTLESLKLAEAEAPSVFGK